ncbi:MAG: hypothetical protein U0802_08160 [Candidatus Binatia bacterium]
MRSLILLLLAVATSARADGAPAWPQTFSANGNQLVAAQPQLDGWANRLDFTGRVGVTVTPSGGAAVNGVLRIAARTAVDSPHRLVTLTGVRITDAQFPSAAPPAASQAAALSRSMLPSELTVSLDYLLAALVQAGQSATSAALASAPPTIFFSEQPARLVQFDGAPVFAPVAGTDIQYAVNTNWPLLRTSDSPALYLLDATGWLTSETLQTGTWMYADQLPASFAQLPDTAEWTDVRQALSAPVPGLAAPLLVYVAQTPAELIVVAGEPQYQQAPGTGIYAVTNTDSLLFWDGYAKAYYYLVAGRWFRADGLNGPWTAATSSLPADFANLPPDGPLAAVRASVPGTPEAKEAALQAQIPRLASVSRTATATVSYDGAPQFAPIDGTSLSYAVNTPSDVIRVGDAYYLCQNGVWFTAASPSGPWSAAAAVPDAIYAIPPSSPLYNVTYVRLYEAAADQLVYGYTDGYLGEYVADGVVTWGTGYAYAPYIGVGAAPIYYARPYTYGCDAFYNPLNGTFHRAGYGYGPYGGIAAGAAYNPATGTYARGAAVNGPYQSGAAAQAYNPRTGTYAAAETRANPYAAWSQGVVSGPRTDIQVGAVSDDRGSATRVQTARGAEAVAVQGDDRSATVVRSPGGDWYAGGDGHLYQRADAGWQRADTGIPGLGRPVDAGGYADSRYVPSRPVASGGYVPSQYVPSREVASGLDADYAARQRQGAMNQRSGGWGGSGFSGLGGGRYGGVAGGGGRR